MPHRKPKFPVNTRVIDGRRRQSGNETSALDGCRFSGVGRSCGAEARQAWTIQKDGGLR
jgi:hypothetical protein